jgi:hypothetical protein
MMIRPLSKGTGREVRIQAEQIGVRKMVNRCCLAIGVQSIDEGFLQIEYIF